MKSFAKKIGFVLIAIVGVTTLISIGSLWSLSHSSFYKSSFLVNDVEQDNFDYIILGASNGLTTLNTKLIDSLSQTTGLNLAMDDTALSSQYLMLQHFLAEKKSAKYCVLASSPGSFDILNTDINDNDYRFLMYVNRPYVSNYYGNFKTFRSKLAHHSKWMPVLGLSYYNAELFYPSLMAIASPNRRNRFDDRGNYNYPNFETRDEAISEFKEIPILFKNSYVSKIQELCSQNNMKLIIYISPMEGQIGVINTNDYQVLNHSAVLKNKKYFHDKIHVNSLGRYEASSVFAEDMKHLFQIND